MSSILPISIYNNATPSKTWTIVNDDVMGGVSRCSINNDPEGFMIFKGHVSTAYNGGFSAIKLAFSAINIQNYQRLVLKIKGDGKRYQFRVKESHNDVHSFVHYFETDGRWQQLKISLKDLKARFRGRPVSDRLFSNTVLEEIGILIANKTDEDFQLLIASIYLE